MKERESKHAKTLLKLGFKKTSGSQVKSFLDMYVSRLGRPLTRKERRIITKETKRPSFTREPEIDPPITQAMDEHGCTWEADGHIDLSPLGFLDNAAWMERTFGIKLGPPRKYN